MVAAPVATTICQLSKGERISFTESNTIFAATFRSVKQGLGVYFHIGEFLLFRRNIFWLAIKFFDVNRGVNTPL